MSAGQTCPFWHILLLFLCDIMSDEQWWATGHTCFTNHHNISPTRSCIDKIAIWHDVTCRRSVSTDQRDSILNGLQMCLILHSPSRSTHVKSQKHDAWNKASKISMLKYLLLEISMNLWNSSLNAVVIFHTFATNKLASREIKWQHRQIDKKGKLWNWS